METVADELVRARELSTSNLADAIETIGFECTRCGACCTADGDEAHTATVFPGEVRTLADATERDWEEVARPMPYGLRERDDGKTVGETFEWALQTDSCGDCTFYAEAADGTGSCQAHEHRPLICQTYPFSVDLNETDSSADGGATEPQAVETVDRHGPVRAHECEGLGREIDRADAEKLAHALKERTIRELEETMGVHESYRPTPAKSSIVVHDSEGAKRPDGTRVSPDTAQ
ncbi:YkgJ family cysteine cluster protein [Halobacteria archaeon AArc-dxtr1]|nr:YkgJ family cysteine cluster protein [Halobacteria archaeon AArc-dxtr1]